MSERQATARKRPAGTERRKRQATRRSRGGRRAEVVLQRSTARVEKLHRAVASLPLDVLERVERLEKPVTRVRRLQERAITARYALVRGINAEITKLLRAPQVQTKRKAKSRRSARAKKPVMKAVGVERPAAVAS